MTKFKQLINPHSHSDYSLDGAATVSQIVERNKQLGASYVTLTEHGNMNSAMELYKTAKQKGITPILGMEAYLINPWHNEYVEIYRKAISSGVLQIREKNPEAIENAIQKKAMNHYLHITVHFKDAWAYQYFCKISPKMWSRSIKKYSEEKPLITMEELEAAAGHITIGSSCMKGPVQYFMLPSKDGLIPPQPEKSKYMYEWLKRIAGKESFFVEVFPHQVTHEWQKPEKDYSGRIIKEGYFKAHECTCHAPNGDYQKPLNEWVIHLAESNKDKAIISLDSHYATKNQKVIQDARLGNGDENWRFYNYYHIMSTEEAAEVLRKTLGINDRKIEEWVENSYDWASNFDSFKLETSETRWILAGDSDRFMNRLKSTIDKWGRMDWSNQEMVDRLKHEIQVLAHNKKLNLLAYFETIEDVANFCRENGVLMNVRGSAGGSLLLYLIGVSGINPMKHDLSFGRFLTEGRIEANTLPDVDMDVSDQEKVIEYLKSKYGDGICRLSTDLLLRIKSSIKDAERSILGKVRKETEDLCKKLPSTPQGTEDIAFIFGFNDKNTGEHIPGIFDKNFALQKYAEDNAEIWNVVKEMLGIQRNKSSHACYVGETLILIYEDNQVKEKRIDACDGKTVFTGQGSIAKAKLINQGKKKVKKYTLENGKTLVVTPDHLMLTKKGWMTIEQVFQEGEGLISLSKTVDGLLKKEKESV
jgi:DNA polymerase-3 subunit alpha